MTRATQIGIAALAVAWAAAYVIVGTLLVAGCSSQVAPQADTLADVDLEADVGSLEAHVDVGDVGSPSLAIPTSQPAEQSGADDQSAGRDNSPVTVNLNASGSGWAVVASLVAVAAIVAGLLLLVMYVRAKGHEADARHRELAAAHNVDRSLAEYRALEANARAVAKAVRKLGPGPQRDRLLAIVADELPDADAWQRTIGDERVRRSHKGQGAA